jgi:hypothetical protein
MIEFYTKQNVYHSLMDKGLPQKPKTASKPPVPCIVLRYHCKDAVRTPRYVVDFFSHYITSVQYVKLMIVIYRVRYEPGIF